MNVGIFWVRAMKCMCAQTRPWFILSSERVFWGMEFEPMWAPREKSPEEDWTRAAVDSEPKHCQLSYSGPPSLWVICRTFIFITESHHHEEGDAIVAVAACGGVGCVLFGHWWRQWQPPPSLPQHVCCASGRRLDRGAICCWGAGL